MSKKYASAPKPQPKESRKFWIFKQKADQAHQSRTYSFELDEDDELRTQHKNKKKQLEKKKIHDYVLLKSFNREMTEKAEKADRIAKAANEQWEAPLQNQKNQTP